MILNSNKQTLKFKHTTIKLNEKPQTENIPQVNTNQHFHITKQDDHNKKHQHITAKLVSRVYLPPGHQKIIFDEDLEPNTPFLFELHNSHQDLLCDTSLHHVFKSNTFHIIIMMNCNKKNCLKT